MTEQNSNKSSPIIEFKNVKKSFFGKTILGDISFKVYPGEIFCIIGGSGTGKSVSLKLLMGLIPFDDGEIYYKGKPLSGLSEEDMNLIRPDIGMVFQNSALFDSLNIYENISYPLHEQGKLTEEEIEKVVEEKLAMVDLPGIEHLEPSDLSGGMKKRVGLARAIATDPEVILYDEPTAGLDPTNVNRIDNLILNMKKKLNVTSVVVTHNMPSVFKIADKVALLYDKKISFIGTISELKQSQNPIVSKFIKGEIGE